MNVIARQLAAVVALLAGTALGQAPTFTPAPTPLLQQMSQETEQLHRHVSASIVRVQIPERLQPEFTPAEELLRKWEPRLDPAVRQHLVAQLRQQQGGLLLDDPFVLIRSAADRGTHGLVLIHHVQQPGVLNVAPPARPKALGLLLDDRGTLLVPSYVDRETAGALPIRVMLGDGQPSDAAFVGSDRQTNLTLLRLRQPAGRPAAFALQRPANGSLVLIYSPQNDSAQLSVWTGSSRESGMVVLPDGRIAGFALGGQFLSAPAAVPIVQQLMQHGHVRRATVGVRVSEVRGDDAIRQVSGLGTQPAIRVDRVSANSAAEQSGLRAGDLILTVGGESVGDLPNFAALIAARNGPTDLHVVREGQPITVNVRLDRR